MQNTSSRKHIRPKDLGNPLLEVAHVARHTTNLAGCILQLFHHLRLSPSRRGCRGHGGETHLKPLSWFATNAARSIPVLLMQLHACHDELKKVVCFAKVIVSINIFKALIVRSYTDQLMTKNRLYNKNMSCVPNLSYQSLILMSVRFKWHSRITSANYTTQPHWTGQDFSRMQICITHRMSTCVLISVISQAWISWT